MHLGDHAPGGAQALLLRVVRRRARQRTGLVRAVELQHVRAGAILELLGPFVRHHLAAGEHDAQGREVVAVDRVGVEHHDELGRDRGEHGDPVVLDRTQHDLGVEACAHDARGAGDCRREVRGPQPESEGGGSADRKTSEALKSATRSAKSWNANQRDWLCITIFGRPVVPDVELRYQSSSAPMLRPVVAAPARSGGSRRRIRAPLRSTRCATSRSPARAPIPTPTTPAFSHASIAACTPGPSAICNATRSPAANSPRAAVIARRAGLVLVPRHRLAAGRLDERDALGILGGVARDDRGDGIHRSDLVTEVGDGTGRPRCAR